ncbi:hypothetical protein H0H92_006850 [Tricholoma furcatifolium]|nr:hypothetical protein H0H92_006850 [Tricholoma furcatifolium]
MFRGNTPLGDIQSILTGNITNSNIVIYSSGGKQIFDETYEVLRHAAELTPVHDLQKAAALALVMYDATKVTYPDTLKALSYNACALVYMIMCNDIQAQRIGMLRGPDYLEKIENLSKDLQGTSRFVMDSVSKMLLLGLSDSDVAKHNDRLKHYFDVFSLYTGEIPELLRLYNEWYSGLLANIKQKPEREREQQTASTGRISGTRGFGNVNHDGNLNRQAISTWQPLPGYDSEIQVPQKRKDQQLGQEYGSDRQPPPGYDSEIQALQKRKDQQLGQEYGSDRSFHEPQPSQHPAFNQNQTPPFPQPDVHQYYSSASAHNTATVFPRLHDQIVGPIPRSPSMLETPLSPQLTATVTTGPDNWKALYKRPITMTSGDATVPTTGSDLGSGNFSLEYSDSDEFDSPSKESREARANALRHSHFTGPTDDIDIEAEGIGKYSSCIYRMLLSEEIAESSVPSHTNQDDGHISNEAKQVSTMIISSSQTSDSSSDFVTSDSSGHIDANVGTPKVPTQTSFVTPDEAYLHASNRRGAIEQLLEDGGYTGRYSIHSGFNHRSIVLQRPEQEIYIALENGVSNDLRASLIKAVEPVPAHVMTPLSDNQEDKLDITDKQNPRPKIGGYAAEQVDNGGGSRKRKREDHGRTSDGGSNKKAGSGDGDGDDSAGSESDDDNGGQGDGGRRGSDKGDDDDDPEKEDSVDDETAGNNGRRKPTKCRDGSVRVPISSTVVTHEGKEKFDIESYIEVTVSILIHLS